MFENADEPGLRAPTKHISTEITKPIKYLNLNLIHMIQGGVLLQYIDFKYFFLSDSSDVLLAGTHRFPSDT